MSDELLAGFRWMDGSASDAEVDDAQLALGSTLPSDYVAVLRKHDGGEGWVGDGEYLRLWRLSELVANNRTLDAHLSVPDTVLIGTNGGGEVFGVRRGSDDYWSYPAVGLSVDLGRHLGDTWVEFLTALTAIG